jgi:hypothetical protein
LPEIEMSGILEQSASSILSERGPLTLEELGEALRDVGATTSKNPTQTAKATVRYRRRFQQLEDGRWLDRVGALQSARLAHRLTEVERRVGALRVDPDFSLIAQLIEDGTLAAWPRWGGIRVVWVRDASLDSRRRPVPDRFLSLPIGALDGHDAGSRLVLRVHADAAFLELEGPSVAWESSPASIGTIREVAGERLRDHFPDRVPYLWREPAYERVDSFLFEALGRMPELLGRGAEPVGSLLRHAGLESHRDLVGVPGTLWARIDDRSAIWTNLDAEDTEELPFDAVEDDDGNEPRDWTKAETKSIVGL